VAVYKIMKFGGSYIVSYHIQYTLVFYYICML